LRSLQEIQPDFVEETKASLGCGAKERRRRIIIPKYLIFATFSKNLLGICPAINVQSIIITEQGEM
jgi:hypothetical protein